jgi:sugar-specific transcriptional regulator TrmB
LQENTVEKTLQDFGLTEKETEIYVYLAKHGLQKGVEIAKKTNTAKAVVYRILKILQRKGFVESTLESPIRFKAVPFETILDSKIKAKHEEARQIETAKKDLLNDWGKISKGEPESPIEKIVVIEGNQKIYNKIYQMIKQTKSQLSFIATVPGIMQSDRYGIISEIINHPLKSKAKFRFLTDMTNANTNSVRFIKQKLRTNADLRGRNPELGLKPFPRMVIRDQEEILFFITPKSNQNNFKSEDICLCTNCKSMIQAFSIVFENLWQNSSDIEQKIGENETEKISKSTQFLADPISAKKKYEENLNSAKNEILMVTSSEGLAELSKKDIEDWSARRVTIKIMAPIITENLKTARNLSGICEVRHIPIGYLPTTVIDGKKIYQFTKTHLEHKSLEKTSQFKNVFFTDDTEYVNKTKRLLMNLWKDAQVPSTITVQEALNPSLSTNIPTSDEKPFSIFKKTIMGIEKEPLQKKTDDIISEFIKAKKHPIINPSKDLNRAYCSAGYAIVHPPPHFNLPKMMFNLYHIEKQSSLGTEDTLGVYLWLKTQNGYAYVPSVQIGDNPETINYYKVWFAGLPAENNIHLVKKDALQIRVHGNSLFAGWTVPIRLNDSCFIPPSCLIIEGYGNLKTTSAASIMPSGYKFHLDSNGFDAYVTYIHPTAIYNGPGTEGYISRDVIMDIIPPKEGPN